jgi:Xaa-Pro aminopeptidase
VRVPFNAGRLDARLQRDGVDLIFATSPHNVAYMLGGYEPHFFKEMAALGVSRHAAAVGYPCGRPDRAFYIGNPIEASQQQLEPLWVSEAVNTVWTGRELSVVAADLIRGLGLGAATIALELPFIPADAYLALRESLPSAVFVDAVSILEDLRAVKLPRELALISEASDAIVDSMVATFESGQSGVTTAALARRLAEEERSRGLRFDYCLAAVGPHLNRTPSATKWTIGAALSLDSGGSKLGYIGDLARMAVLGEPSRLQLAVLAEVDLVQQAARGPIRAGTLSREIYARAELARAGCAHREALDFVAHGMGLVSHEAPRITSAGPIPYEASHADLPLEAGMVLSIETTVVDREVGLVKLEDTIAVTETGWEAFGDRARGWQVVS